MSHIIDLLREHGYKYTVPRKIVAEVLQNSQTHMSANAIWEATKALDGSISRMSVYRTLELFTQIGYIRPTSQHNDDERHGLIYVLMKQGHHHHIICQGCGLVIEFDDCGLEKLGKLLEEQYQCQILGHLLEFFGYCPKCLRSQAPTAADSATPF